MPPKSTKSDKKRAEKVVADKTFGLKNKNRSTKVQQYCEQVAGSVKGGNRNIMKSEAELEARRAAKREKQAFEEAMKRIEGTTDKKPGHDDDSHSDEEGEQDKQLGVDPSEYLWTADDFDEVAHDEHRLEERLEAEREALKGRTDLTPVTEETFRAWKEKKKAEKEAKEKERLGLAKSGKAKLRGWDLWQLKKELFVDDEDGEEAYVKEFDDAALFEEDEEADEGDFDLGDEDGAAAGADSGKKKDGDDDDDN